MLIFRINPDFQMKNSFHSGQESLGFDYVLSTLLKSWFNLINVIWLIPFSYIISIVLGIIKD